MEELQLAVSSLGAAMHFALPWNFSVAAIDGFLRNTNFCSSDLAGRPNKAALLTGFVNYILGLNAQNWQRKKPFLESRELETMWPAYLRSRTPAGSSAGIAPQFSGGRGGYRGRGGYQNQQNPVRPQLPNFTTPPPPLGAQASHSGQGSGGAGQLATELCRRYNYGVCPNNYANCTTSTGEKLLHLCNADKNGRACRGRHPRIHHH